jgi:sugar phosphate isomerase/epimerase
MARASRGRRRGIALVAAGGLALAAVVWAGGEDGATAPCPGAALPPDRVSIQLFTFARRIGSGADRVRRLDEVLRRVRAIGYRNVEPFSLHGLPAARFKALLDAHGLAAPSGHGSVDPVRFDRTLRQARALGQRSVGSGGFAPPGIATPARTRVTARLMDELGRRSVRNGTGKLHGHNHRVEFRTRHAEPATGRRRSAWEIVAGRTDPRYVAFTLDVLWAADAGEDVARLLRRHGDRVDILHVKDGVDVAGPARATPVALGTGEIDFAPILRAARGRVRLYVVEQDPPRTGSPGDPFAGAR